MVALSNTYDLLLNWSMMTGRDERGSTAVLAHAEDGRWTHGREDNDAAASLEVPIHDCKIATCMHVDEIGGESCYHRRNRLIEL